MEGPASSSLSSCMLIYLFDIFYIFLTYFLHFSYMFLIYFLHISYMFLIYFLYNFYTQIHFVELRNTFWCGKKSWISWWRVVGWRGLHRVPFPLPPPPAPAPHAVHKRPHKHKSFLTSTTNTDVRIGRNTREMYIFALKRSNYMLQMNIQWKNLTNITLMKVFHQTL